MIIGLCLYIYLLWYTYKAYLLIVSTSQYLAIYISGTTDNSTDPIYTMPMAFTSTAKATLCDLPGATGHQ